ncbi:MAG: GNAT family N-acetyltransferase [Candidatus Woesearchaeota archaeon]
MNFEIIEDIDRCKSLWDKYSPKQNLWDEWDIAHAFYEKGTYQLHFILLKDENNNEVGLLPLYKYKDKYYFFGEGYAEMRKFWFDINILPEVIEFMPIPTFLFDMKGEYIEEIITKFPDLEKYFSDKDYRYYLDLRKINHNIENYLLTFNKKHKKNLLYDLKNLKELNYELEWENLEHFDTFIKFNQERFPRDSEQESDYHDEFFSKEVKKFLNVLSDKGTIYSLIVKINGEIQGIEIATFYKNNYYVLNGGYNRNIKNLGKLLIFEHLKKSISLKANEFDLLVGDTGWKKLWNFETDSCYTFTKK